MLEDSLAGSDDEVPEVVVVRVNCCDRPRTYSDEMHWTGEAWECWVKCMECGKEILLARLTEERST